MMDVAVIVGGMIILMFGTHSIRSWACGRHEAITFEGALVAVLISFALIGQYGIRTELIIMCLIMCVMFTVNALVQKHFYDKLQTNIQKAFEKRKTYMDEKDETLKDGKKCNENKEGSTHGEKNSSKILEEMGMVSIMPSFSRFIEESKLFNDPKSFIGLVKSIMRRQRFQKKKYQIRESIAENANLVGPCIPTIRIVDSEKDSMMIRANDLSLEKKDEITGLLSFDILGFGAFVAICVVLPNIYVNSGIQAHLKNSVSLNPIVMAVLFSAFIMLSYVLRLAAFERCESVWYEFSVAALVLAVYRVLDMKESDKESLIYRLLILGIYILLLIVPSIIIRRSNKKLQKKINKKYDEILSAIRLDTETDRVKIRFINNMKYISEWTIVQFPSGNKQKATINRMSSETYTLLKRVVPEYDKLSESDFQRENSVKAQRVLICIIGIVSFASVFVLEGFGIM